MIHRKTFALTRPVSPDELYAQHQLWAEHRQPAQGFLATLLGPKTPAAGRYDHQAGGLLAAIAAFLDGSPYRPASTVDNVAALATYPDLLLVVELLELELPKAQQPDGYALGVWLQKPAYFANALHLVDGQLALGHVGNTVPGPHPKAVEIRTAVEQQLAGTVASLQEFFALIPPSQESIEHVAAYLRKFQQLRFEAPVPGDLWLKTLASQTPIRALPAAMYPYNNSYSQNKLVLGGPGSGRSVMTARLCQAAHERGNPVVMIAFRQRHGPLYHYTRNKQGATREITTRREAAFNPFWIPERFPRTPNVLEPILRYLSDLLVCLLETANPHLPQLRNSYVYALLSAYYQQQPWQATGTHPSFDNFYAFAGSDAAGSATMPCRTCPTCGAEPGCQQSKQRTTQQATFLEAGRPFYDTGELAYLMNADPERASELFTPQNGLLYVQLAVGYLGNELKDAVATSCISWLLLFGVDMHLGWLSPGQYHQRKYFLTVAVDELLDECLTKVATTFIQPYLRSKRYNGQELICSWHHSPSAVFSPEHPVAELIRDSAGCHLLFSPGSPGQQNRKGLWLSDHQLARYNALQRKEVLIVGLREFDGAYDAKMSEQELSLFKESPE